MSRQPTVLSHGLIFHQCAIHIKLTENVLRLKGYEMKGKKKKTLLFLLLGAAKHRHHLPPAPPFCLSAFSPVHPSYIPLFCFETPKSDPAAPQKSSTPAWCISLDIVSRLTLVAAVSLSWRKATGDLPQRISCSGEVMTEKLIST